MLLIAVGFVAKAQEPRTGIRCLTDELHTTLKAQFPEGVPGRTLPVEGIANKTEDFNWTYLIPIVVHVMHDNGPELNVDMAQIQSQIDVLNEDFGKYGAGDNVDANGADVRIQFCLASIDPDGNATTGVNYVEYAATGNIDPFNEDTLLKRVIQWDPVRYLNTYVVRQISNGRISGYAYFPDEAAGTIYDGFVVDYRYFGRDAGTAIARGRTATHEVGHYLGLLHPWGVAENNCDTENDGCDDTPPVGREFFSNYPVCSHPETCDGEERMIENYMDYSDDRCMNIFTNCQAERMRNALFLYRSQLVSSDNLQEVGCSGTVLDDAALNTLQLFPNPVQDVFMVYADFTDEIPSQVEVFDFQGRRIYYNENAGFGRGAIPVDMSGYNAGLYHVAVTRGTTYLRKSILVAR